jgi:hypothetical protein
LGLDGHLSRGNRQRAQRLIEGGSMPSAGGAVFQVSLDRLMIGDAEVALLAVSLGPVGAIAHPEWQAYTNPITPGITHGRAHVSIGHP